MGCETVLKANLGLSRCKVPSVLKGMIELPAGTAISPANFISRDAWRVLLLNPYGSRSYLWPWFKMFEDQSEDAIYEQTALASMKVRDGQYRFKFGIQESLCLHNKLYTHNSSGGDCDVVLIDMENNFLGTVDEDNNIRGFSVDLLNAEKLKFSDGGVGSKSPLYLCLRDNKELDINGVMYKNNFLNQLYRIVDVYLTVVAVSGDDYADVDVKQRCDDTPVQGLLLADWVVTTTGGAAQVLDSAVADANVAGRYRLTKANALLDGFVNLRAASLLTVKAYEAEAAVALEMP